MVHCWYILWPQQSRCLWFLAQNMYNTWWLDGWWIYMNSQTLQSILYYIIQEVFPGFFLFFFVTPSHPFVSEIIWSIPYEMLIFAKFEFCHVFIKYRLSESILCRIWKAKTICKFLCRFPCRSSLKEGIFLFFKITFFSFWSVSCEQVWIFPYNLSIHHTLVPQWQNTQSPIINAIC